MLHAHNHIGNLVSNGVSLTELQRRDPSRTLPLKRRFIEDAEKRFNWLSSVILEVVGVEDVLGFGKETEKKVVVHLVSNLKLTKAQAVEMAKNRNFQFTQSARKIDAFMGWLDEMEQSSILEVTHRPGALRGVEEAWSDTYIQSGYQQGIRRARDEMRGRGVDLPSIGNDLESEAKILFNQPLHADPVGIIYSRSFTELKGITRAMDTQISSILAQGMAEGRGADYVARQLVDRVDKIGKTRARALARTEIANAHHQANINEYEAAGLEGVSVDAEWETGANPCPICSRLRGKVFSLKEIRGMIPVHVNCGCQALPHIGPLQSKFKDAYGYLPDCEMIHDVIPLGILESSFLTLAAKRCLTKTDRARAERALKSHVRATKEVQDKGENNEVVLAKALSKKMKQVTRLDDDEAFDVIIGPMNNPKHLIEVKTRVRGKNRKVTIHPPSMKKKLDFASDFPKADMHLVVFDEIDNKYYYRHGLGSHRFNQMTEVDKPESFYKYITGIAKEKPVVNEELIEILGGAGSGNFGHKGRPGKVGGSGGKRADAADAVDAVINKYLKKFGEEERPKSPPLKEVVFRVVDDKEWKNIQDGEESGGFWTSDPTEYGRHALGSIGQKDAKSVFVAAKFDLKDGKIYRGIVRTPEQAKVAHFQSTKTKGISDVIVAYKWDGQKLSRIFTSKGK